MKSCSFPGCRTQVEDWRFGCGLHWSMLPSNLREKLTLKMQGAEHEVTEWIRATFGAQHRREYDPSQWETLVRMVRARDQARARRRKEQPHETR